jgi:hypothetical protein
MSEEEVTYKIYIIDYWIPFPTSEYGGTIIVTAKSEEEVIELLKTQNWDYCDECDRLMKEAVEESKRYELKGLHQSEFVSIFIT